MLRILGLIRYYEPVRLVLLAIVGAVVLHLTIQTVYLVFFPNRALFVEQEVAEAIFLLEVLILPLTGWVFILSEVSRHELLESRMRSSAHFNALMRSNLAMIRQVFMSIMRTTVMIILMAAFTLQFAFAYLRISHALADLVVSLDLTQMQLVGSSSSSTCFSAHLWKVIPCWLRPCLSF